MCSSHYAFLLVTKTVRTIDFLCMVASTDVLPLIKNY
ncbi:hypothetical protein SAMN05443667_10493 [Flavobacterium gillisiae]|uniref:Uncharacterized protein n=1 Tax=Flavobacterium gillisiae TaxID=150146 RepID=A0A1H4AXT8_9FLAO|nr:hypothetical protein SAMN05443667_10493 [Flavobacterium gillisiae]